MLRVKLLMIFADFLRVKKVIIFGSAPGAVGVGSMNLDCCGQCASMALAIIADTLSQDLGGKVNRNQLLEHAMKLPVERMEQP